MQTPSLFTRCTPPPGRLRSFLTCTLAALSLSFAHAGTVTFVTGTSLSTPADWSSSALPVTTDSALFTDAGYGGPLPTVVTNGTAQTWGNLTWNSNVSGTISGSSLTLSGGAGTNEIITLGSLMTSGTLVYGLTTNTQFITATNAVINVVNAGATLNVSTQFEFNNTVANQVITKTGAGTINFQNGNNGNAGAGAGSKFVLDAGTVNFSNGNGNMFGGSASTVFEIHNGTFLDTAGASFDVVSSKNYAQTWAGDFTFKGTTKNLNLGTGAVTLTGGSRQVTVNALTLTVAGVIGDGGNGYGLTKAGAGGLTLSNMNTYTGATTVDAGTLTENVSVISGSLSNSASDYISTSSTLVLGGGTYVLAGRANGLALSSTTSAAYGSGATSVTLGSVAGLVVGQAFTLATGSPAGEYIKSISGNVVTLGIATTASGTAGTGASASSTVVNTSQTFAGLTVKAGASTIAPTSPGNSTTVNLGAITRNAGGLLTFTLPASGAITTSSGTDAFGLLGAGLTVGNNDWATLSGTSVVAFTAYTTQNSLGSWAANQNITTSAQVSGSLGANLALGSLRLNPGNAFASIINLNGKILTVNDGILQTSTTGQGASITNGTLQGANGDLVVINRASGLTISANVVDNSTATAFTKGGAATVVLSGSNTYTGATYVDTGTLQAGSAAPSFGNNSAVVVSTGAALNLNNFSQSIGSLASNNPTGTGLLTLGTGSLTTGGNNTSTVFNGTITGSGGFTKVGTGTQTLSGNNTYTGATSISAGTLLLSSASNNIASSTSIINNAVLDVSNISSGFALASGQTLSGTGTVVGALTVASGATLAIGNSPGTMTFNSDLTLAAGSTENFEINGLTSGLYDLAQGGAGVQSVAFDGTLNLVFQAGFNTLGTVKIFDFENYSGNFGLVNTSGLAGGYTATFDQLTGNVTVVPEPSTYALIAAGLAMVWVVRRRQRTA
ncbi:hypothetical protein BH09VER1_BH09VER1_28040 [soil metagenome]